MLRDVWFWEVEVVRVEDGAPAAPPWRLDFSLTPLNYLLGGLLAGAVACLALLGYARFDPFGSSVDDLAAYCRFGPADPFEYEPRHCCGCGAAARDTRTAPDSTLLVRRLR